MTAQEARNKSIQNYSGDEENKDAIKKLEAEIEKAVSTGKRKIEKTFSAKAINSNLSLKKYFKDLGYGFDYDDQFPRPRITIWW